MYSAKDVKIMSDMTNTQFFRVADEQHIEVSDILNTVCKALTERDITLQSDSRVYHVGRSYIHYQS